MRILQFFNKDAIPRVVEVQVSTASVKPIMAWYGGYHAGDDYMVMVDGVEVQKDLNGELVGDLP
jgi:hypothetical protein